MEKLSGFDFQEIQFDTHGQLTTGLDDLAKFVEANPVTDVILMCHGFRNDEAAARGLYGEFLQNFAQSSTQPSVTAALTPRKFAVGGVFWPSMILPEPHDAQGGALAADPNISSQERLEALKQGQDAATQSQLQKMISLVSLAQQGDTNAQLDLCDALLKVVNALPVEEANECRAAFANATPAILQQALLMGDAQETVQLGAAAGGAMGIPTLTDDDNNPPGPGGRAQSFLGKVFGFVPTFLNLTTFLLMFHRCGDVGANGMSQAVRRLKAIPKSIRVHLVGHSLGGRAVTACANALTSAPVSAVDSMMLLEAAYSHFGLSAGTGASGIPHPRGFFRDVIEKNAVKGPIVATFSDQDWVVGFAYTSMAAASLNNARAFGDEKSPFGGIGRNGVLDTAEATSQDLKLSGDSYSFTGPKIHCLNGSRQVNGKALISSHGDVRNPSITWAFASLVATT